MIKLIQFQGKVNYFWKFFKSIAQNKIYLTSIKNLWNSLTIKFRSLNLRKNYLCNNNFQKKILEKNKGRLIKKIIYRYKNLYRIYHKIKR
jgi:hypothetical protein